MLNTLTAAKELQNAGIPEEQAESIIHVIVKNNDDQINKLATREDLKDVRYELKQDIANVRAELKADIAEVRTEIQDVRTELKEDISDVKLMISQQKWQMIGIMAGLLAIFKGLDLFI